MHLNSAVLLLFAVSGQFLTTDGQYSRLRESQDRNTVRVNKNVPIPQGSASLAFVFDITGSMQDDLLQVIEGAAKILATTLRRREKPLYNYVLVPFHDPGECFLILFIFTVFFFFPFFFFFLLLHLCSASNVRLLMSLR